MALYDRPYMQEPDYRFFSLKPLYWLLGSLVAIHFIQKLAVNWFKSFVIIDLFALSEKTVGNGFIWTFLSYGFLHGDLFHLLINGLFLYLFGKIIIEHFGLQKFWVVYGLSVLLGGIIWFTVSALFRSNGAHLIGASGGVAGLLVAWCLYIPNMPIHFWFIRTTPRAVLTVVIIFEAAGFLLNELAPFGAGVAIAHSAHLGGMLGGWVFVKFILNKDFSFSTPEIRPPKWFTSKKTGKASTGRFRINFTNRRELQAEVDRILDKINKQGFGSLSEEERNTLDRAKELLNK